MEGRSDDRAQGGGGIWLDGQQQQQQEQQGQQEELSPPHTLESSVFFSTSSTTATSTSASASASASASTSTSASTSVSASASASSPSSVSFSFSVTNQRKKQRVEGGWGRVGLGGRGVKDRLESREDGYGHHLSLAAAKSMVSVSLSSSGVPREWMRGGILGKARLVESVQSEARRREAAMEAAAAKEYLRRERACMGAATHCISQLRVLDQLVWGERRRWARAVAARAAAAKMASNLHAILSEWSGIAHRRALAGRMRRRNAWRRVRVCYVEWYARGCLSREVVRLRKIYLLKHTFEPVWRRWQLYVRRNKIVRERYRYVVGRRAVAYFHHWRALGRVGGAVRRIQKQARLWLLLLPVKRARYKGSRKIQKAYRRWCVRRDYFAAVTIQALARGYIDREVVGRLGEERRGELEATTLEAALDEAVEEAQRWLKTKEGKHELRQLITRIKVRDATRKQERKDKGLSRAERRQEELIDTFQRYDVDGSQAINSDELSDMLRDLCVPLEEGQLEDILAAVDKDDSGEVELLEFLAWFNGEHSSENSNLDLATRTALQLATIKLKGMKFVHQVTGATLRKQAERIFIGRAIRTATEEARKEFREKYPPRRVCVICGTALPSSGALRHHLIHAQEEHAALAEAEERTKTNLMISD